MLCNFRSIEMSRKRKCLCAFICAFILIFSLCINASALSLESYEVPTLLSVKCTNVPVYCNGKHMGYALERHGIFYVPVIDFLEHFLGNDFTLDYSLPYSALVLSSDKYSFYCYPEHGYISANGRYVPIGGLPREINGRVWFPVSSLTKLIGAELKINEDASSVQIKYRAGSPVPSASDVYNQYDLYWLSRVIYSEAGTQPLEGMIGVGNVVLNRVASPRFPNSVYEVVFQKNQFSVVDCGMIYREPDERSIIAAKLCLEGADSVGDSLYFINPKLCNGSWFRNNLTFRETIGEHDFFV